MLNNDIFYLFLIVSLGYILGNFKIRGFSLDISAILIIAIIAGHYGMIVSSEFKFFGLAIFIYAVGLQSGPGFFETIKSEGIKFNILATLLLFMIFASIAIPALYFNMSSTSIDGMFMGAISSITSLAAALEVKNSPNISVIFSIVYPFGIITSVLFMRILPILFRVDMQKEIREYEEIQKNKYPEIITKNFRIANDNLKKIGIKKSQLEKMTNTKIHRIESNDKIQEDMSNQPLKYGNIIRVSGEEEKLEQINDIISGEEVKDNFSFHDHMKVYRLLVTSKKIIGRKIINIKKFKLYKATITKIRRSGVDIPPYPNMSLMLGDKLYVVAPQKYSEELTKLVGNNFKNYSKADFFSISLGIVFGIILGNISFGFPVIGDVKLSFVGGILITALILGRLGRIGPVVWQISPHSTTLMKNLGQLLFIASIGTHAGKYFVQSLKTNGITPIYIALVGLICSLLIMTIICRFVFKMNFLKILGLLSGAMTSTPSLTMANNTTKTDYSSISYATVYPLSLVLSAIMAQMILKVL